MILVSDLISRIRKVGLDADPDTDYYNDDRDIIPAIDSSVKWLTSQINAAKAQNKNTQEIMRELSFAGVFQLSDKSRVMLPDSIWSIDAIWPLPITVQTPNIAPVVQTDTKVSVARPDKTHVSSSYAAYRKTVEEWSLQNDNPFQPGGWQVGGGNPALLVEGSNLNVVFGYLDPYTYSGYPTTVTPAAPTNVEIEIAPAIPNKLVTLMYCKTPSLVALSTDKILFPTSAFDIIYIKALQYISYSQGDGTTIWQVTEQDVAKLFKSVS